MKPYTSLRRRTAAAALVLCACTTGLAVAQTVRGVAASPAMSRPAPSAGGAVTPGAALAGSGLTAGTTGAALPPGAPSAAGITAGSGTTALGQGAPSPAGITAGSGLPSATSGVPVTTPGLATGAAAGIAGSVPADAVVPPNTAVMGGVGAATPGSPVAAVPRTALQVLQSFQGADINNDGQLTRAEAQRVALPNTFEELDRNKDGLLSRGEYEDAFR